VITSESSCLRRSLRLSDSSDDCQCHFLYESYGDAHGSSSTFGIVHKRAIDVQLHLILITVRL